MLSEGPDFRKKHICHPLLLYHGCVLNGTLQTNLKVNKTKTHTVFFWLFTTQTDVKLKDRAENIEEIQWAVLNGDPGDD